MRGAFLLLLLVSCSPYRNVCTDLREKLEGCGFPVGGLDCSRIVYSDVENLTQRLEDRGCDGVRQVTDENAVDQRLCVLNDWKCPGTPIPSFTAAVPVNPIVLVSGIDSTATFDWHPRIAGLHLKVLPWATTKERSEDLWQSIVALRARLGGKKLNLVCYAVGGIDCRFVASPNGLFAGKPLQHAKVMEAIASITTVATPHRGTRVAEAAISALQSGTASELIEAFVGDAVNANVPDDAQLLRTLEGLTLDALEKLNRTLVDAPIPYFSWAGVSSVQARTSAKSEELIAKFCPRILRHVDTHDAMNPALWATSAFSATTHGDDGRVVTSPSDGMVSVASATWGEFQGCIPADHYDVIGQIAHTTRDPLTGFDAPLFYAYVAAQLAEKGL